MEPAIRSVIEALYRSPRQCVLALTGGGAQSVAWLFGVAGASRNILEVSIPYHEQALSDYLGRRPDQFCSLATSQALALCARDRARWLTPGKPVLGLGCTASLVSDRPKRGEHRCHVAVTTDSELLSWSVTLDKGQRERLAEEHVVSVVVLNALAQAADLDPRVPLPLMDGDRIERQSTPLPTTPVIQEGSLIHVSAEGRWMPCREPVNGPALIFPGSFHPVHRGHWQLAEAARRWTNLPIAFELSLRNVDKPDLSLEEARRRAAALADVADLWLTRAPTFAEKSELFPGCTFVVGADTARRIVEGKYYQNDASRRDAALAKIARLGCKFLMGGRADDAQTFVKLADLPIPEAFRGLFDEIPEELFRVDVSSTSLRNRP